MFLSLEILKLNFLFFSRATVADGDWLVRMKYHVYSVLANIGAALPCISDWSSGLPRVTGQSFLTCSFAAQVQEVEKQNPWLRKKK